MRAPSTTVDTGNERRHGSFFFWALSAITLLHKVDLLPPFVVFVFVLSLQVTFVMIIVFETDLLRVSVSWVRQLSSPTDSDIEEIARERKFHATITSIRD